MTPPSQPPVPGPGAWWPSALVAAGLVYLGLGVLLGVAFVMGGVHSSLFPTGWVFPAVLVISGALMGTRRRFDIVVTLWAGLALIVFMLDVLVYMNALDRGLDDAAAFDGAVIVASLGLVALLLRPGFRD
jgi:hypothetical protein